MSIEDLRREFTQSQAVIRSSLIASAQFLGHPVQPIQGRAAILLSTLCGARQLIVYWRGLHSLNVWAAARAFDLTGDVQRVRVIE